jgi:hypothetical protein
MRIGYSVLLTIVLATGVPRVLPGQGSESSGIRGPVMGYVFDAPKKAIRPINGIPGSSLLGRRLDVPFPVTAAAVSPDGDFVLAVSGLEDHAVHVLRGLGSAITMDVIENAITDVDRIIFSGDGLTAVLFAPSTRQLQVVRSLRESPTAEPPIDVSDIGGTITALAIDSKASTILIGASDDHGTLFLASADARIPPRLIANLGSPAAITLVNGDQDIIVADSALNEITLIRNFSGGAAESFRIADERDGVSVPVGLGISGDRHKLYIANRGSRTLDVWNFDIQSIEASYPLDAEPTQLTPLHDSSTFLLNDIGDHPLLVLDLSTGPAIYFVPAGRN